MYSIKAAHSTHQEYQTYRLLATNFLHQHSEVSNGLVFNFNVLEDVIMLFNKLYT